MSQEARDRMWWGARRDQPAQRVDLTKEDWFNGEREGMSDSNLFSNQRVPYSKTLNYCFRIWDLKDLRSYFKM